MSWKRLIAALGITIALFTIAYFLVQGIVWMADNHFEWFKYILCVVVFIAIVCLVYSALAIQSRPPCKGNKHPW